MNLLINCDAMQIILRIILIYIYIIDMKNLYELHDNQICTIVDFKIQASSRLRLAEMGVMLGVEVRMIRKTPLGGPIQIKINNYYLTLRKEDALLIYIRINN